MFKNSGIFLLFFHFILILSLNLQFNSAIINKVRWIYLPNTNLLTIFFINLGGCSNGKKKENYGR